MLGWSDGENLKLNGRMGSDGIYTGGDQWLWW